MMCFRIRGCRRYLWVSWQIRQNYCTQRIDGCKRLWPGTRARMWRCTPDACEYSMHKQYCISFWTYCPSVWERHHIISTSIIVEFRGATFEEEEDSLLISE